ncbi:MAG: hypothetical protein VX446_04665, partial [Bacteroidota bacterium]|nr:hypothetical protein [Bacteroidota bacterium]
MDKQPTSPFLRSVLLAVSTLASSAMHGQNDLVVHVDGLSNDTVYLANYYGAKLFYNDTAVADAKGTVTFKGKPFEEGGKYAVVVPGPKFFEVMMVDEPMEFKTTAANPSGDIEVIQSKENEVFYGYLNFIKDKRTERAPFDAVLRDSSATEDAVAEAKAGIAKLTDEVNEYQYYLTNDPRNFLFGKYLNMINEPQVPEAPENVEDAAMWQYL